jgi:hypothetical protein
MGMTFTKESDGLLVISVQGVLTFEDQRRAERRASEEINRSKKVKILALLEQFSGWGREGDWGDLTFMYESDPYIEKIAVVAEANWKDQLLMHLGAGRRQAAVEFFFPGEEEDARDWLEGKN